MVQNSDLNLDQILAKDIMSEVCITLKPDTSISQAAHLMLRTKVSGAPIIDENKKIVGIITITDLFILMDRIAKGVNDLEASISLHEIFETTRKRYVTEIMTKTVVSVTSETSLKDIIDLVVKWHIHTFPIIDKGLLVGVLDRHDILNAAYVYA